MAKEVQNVPAGRKSGFGGYSCVREEGILLFYCLGHPDQGTLAFRYFNPLFSEGVGRHSYGGVRYPASRVRYIEES